MGRYNKPGKGVDKDAPEKRPFFKFFELLWRRPGRLVVINILYFITTLPFMMVFFNLVNLAFGLATQASVDGEAYLSMMARVFPLLDWPWQAWLILAGIGALLFGPFTCGLTYVCRNFAREEHAWTSDYFARAKKNWRQGMILGIIDLLICSVIVFNIFFAPHLVENPGELLFVIARYGTVAIGLNYFIMRPYLYLLVVTFYLPLKTIFKNAWILSTATMLRSIIFLVVATVTFMLFQMWSVLEMIFILFAFSFWSLLSMFLAWPVVVKYMVNEDDPMLQTAATESEEDELGENIEDA